LRCGIGYDVHKLAAGRALVLGGVTVPYELGLEGHSDADVLVHAIMDAILGAAALGDIGRHFPDTDSRYKGISSICLLEQVIQVTGDAGYTVNNVDSIVVAQKPKLAPYIDRMKETLAGAMNIALSDMNIKATTTEGLGFTGTGEGIAAYAVVTMARRREEG